MLYKAALKTVVFLVTGLCATIKLCLRRTLVRLVMLRSMIGNPKSWWKAALSKSLVYCLFFGIGAFGAGGGEPGFMLPAPILPAAIVSLVESDIYVFLQNTLMPYGVWAAVLFTFYCVRQTIRHLKKPNAIT